MNYPAILQILENIYEKINENTIIRGTVYENVEELKDDIMIYMDEMEDNNGNWIQYLDLHFNPNSNFHKLAINNGWEKDFFVLKDQYFEAKK